MKLIKVLGALGEKNVRNSTDQKSKEVGSRDANTANSVEFVHFYPRFELPLNMNSLSDLGPVDFLSRYNLMIIAIMKGSLR